MAAVPMLHIAQPHAASILQSHEEYAMKLITRIAVVALAAAPLAALAQSEGLTRAQVKQDLQRVEQAGYNPSERDAFYPDNIQAAEEKLQSSTAYGASPDGTSASGQAPAQQNAQ
ncbi:membrane protein [Caballeronia cordobensis]|uniref:Membrane protein n=2 Tax=Caballeronia cordobensis TaxID=1353886 RepID=A0A158HUJ6_CABCO|nr:membrane protein [Caballeronia cordobensis]